MAQTLVMILDSGPHHTGWPYGTEDEPGDRILAKRAPTDDDALFELVRRDKRYLATELVQARLYEWSLLVRLSKLRLPTSSATGGYAARGTQAKRQLDLCAQALRGDDEPQTTLLEPFARDFLLTRKRILHAVRLLRRRRPSSFGELADQCGIDESIAELLNRKLKRPPIVEATLEQLRVGSYRHLNVTPKTLRRYYDAARRFSLMRKSVLNQHSAE